MMEVRDLAKSIEAKHTLFVLDACFSGHAIPPVVENGAKEDSILLATPDPEYAVQVITAGDSSQQVPANSIFTRWFLKAITTAHADADDDRDGRLTGTELGVFLHKKISHVSGHRQTPYRSRFGGTGEFVFHVPRDNP